MKLTQNKLIIEYDTQETITAEVESRACFILLKDLTLSFLDNRALFLICLAA